ncbi:DMT family transporter [Alphaproteobacteria bacterium]|nr:DMT family transporter [Alphaproteobacteria bacterium]
MTAVVLGHLPLAITGIFIFGLPNINGLIFILVSSFLHVFYQILLLNAYRYGGLSEVYPVARGLSPLIIISISLFFLNEDISFYEVLGIFMISLSLIIKQIRNNNSNIKGFYLAIATGCLIASYSIVDGHGARVTQNPVGFFSSMTLINALIFYCFARWKERQIIKKIFVGEKISFFVGGAASYAAYGIVVWACLYLPIAVVSSVRETSILFAVFLGLLFLKEKLNFFKLFLIIGLFAGLIFLRLG